MGSHGWEQTQLPLSPLPNIFLTSFFIFCCFHYFLFGIGKDWISELCSHSWFRSRLRFWDLGFAAGCQSIVPLFHRQWDNCTIAQRAAANNASNSPYIPFSTSLSSSFSSSFSFFTFSFTSLSTIIITSISTNTDTGTAQLVANDDANQLHMPIPKNLIYNIHEKSSSIS